jgi:hypothetical protein
MRNVRINRKSGQEHPQDRLFVGPDGRVGGFVGGEAEAFGRPAEPHLSRIVALHDEANNSTCGILNKMVVSFQSEKTERNDTRKFERLKEKCSMTVKYHYNSLEDFLATNPLSVDGQVDDGGGVLFPVKGREIDATILFSDISGFSRRTLDLSPTETLIFVNNFCTWISAEALQGRPGIVDKYIGDEIMIVFSKEFGSADSLRRRRADSSADVQPRSLGLRPAHRHR